MTQELFKKIETASVPDFGIILSKSFDLFKKVWVESLLHTLITMIAVIPFFIIIYLPFIPLYIDLWKHGSYGNFEPNFDFPIIMIVGYFVLFFILIIIIQGISIAIIAHFFQVCKKADTDSTLEIGGYFRFFLGANFSKVFLLSLSTFVILITVFLLCFIPILYVIVPLQLIVVIFAFNKTLSVSEIINVGFKLGNKFWLFLFGLIIISSLLAQLGVILCFIGALFTAYFVHIPIYYFYKETIGFGDEQQGNYGIKTNEYDY